ncbi:MAG: DUF3341 domain-containing protein [Alphaproteobacteria bacterium]|nr:DUF3341 domain-containing protein [Alphaproteobacteria bacterium]
MNEPPFGIVAVFDRPAAIVETAHHLRELGFRAVDAFTPYPMEELSALLHPRRQVLLPLLIFAGAVIGAAAGWFIQYWDEAINYPLNVGGRPYNSWPAFVVSAFEITLLFAIAAGFFGLWLACGLPRLYHPMFETDLFDRASRDRFLLCVEARDPSFEPDLIRRLFEHHGATEIAEVPA